MSNSTEAIAAQGRKRKSRPYTRRRPRPRFSTSGVMSTNARTALRVTEEEGRLQEAAVGAVDETTTSSCIQRQRSRRAPNRLAALSSRTLRRPRANEAVEAAGDSAGVPQCFIFAVAIDAGMPAAEALAAKRNSDAHGRKQPPANVCFPAGARPTTRGEQDGRAERCAGAGQPPTFRMRVSYLSTISLARRRNLGGNARCNARAARALRTNSNRVDSCTGRSAGRSPRRILTA